MLMKHVKIFLVSVAGFALAVEGCAKDQPASVASEKAGSTIANSSASPPKSAEIPKYAKNAQWTIRCRAIAGPGHIERSMTLKESVAAGTKLKNWHLLHQEEESLLFYGFYGPI